MSDAVHVLQSDAFKARLKKRYAAEKRFKALGLGAIVFSVAVLLFLLVTMSINGIGGFQRAELRVPVDMTQVGFSAPTAEDSDPAVFVRSLGRQGLEDVVAFSAEQALGADGAAQLNGNAWREVAFAMAEDPALLRSKTEFWSAAATASPPP